MKPKPDLEAMEEDILARGEDPSLFPVLNSKPDLFSDLLWIWEGFMCLNVSRQYGMAAPQPISITDINSYCLFREVYDPDERDDFLFHVQRLDSVFMDDWRKKHPTDKNRSAELPQGLGQA